MRPQSLGPTRLPGEHNRTGPKLRAIIEQYAPIPSTSQVTGSTSPKLEQSRDRGIVGQRWLGNAAKQSRLQPPVPDPFTALDAAIASLTTASFTGGSMFSTAVTLDPCGLRPIALLQQRSLIVPDKSNAERGLLLQRGVYYLKATSRINGDSPLILLRQQSSNNGDKGSTLNARRHSRRSSLLAHQPYRLRQVPHCINLRF